MAISSQRTKLEASRDKTSMWHVLPGFKESWPGLLAIVVIALFCELPGLAWPFTMHRLLVSFWGRSGALLLVDSSGL